MTRLTMRVAAGLGALVLAGSIAGCARPTTAATVGPDRISVDQVATLVAGLPDEVRAGPGKAQESLALSLQMRGLAAQQVAKDRGINNLRPRAQAAVDQLHMSDELRADPELQTLLVSEAEVFVLREQIGATELDAAFSKIPVTVNPRYGFSGLEPFDSLRNTSLSKRAGQPE